MFKALEEVTWDRELRGPLEQRGDLDKDFHAGLMWAGKPGQH